MSDWCFGTLHHCGNHKNRVAHKVVQFFAEDLHCPFFSVRPSKEQHPISPPPLLWTSNIASRQASAHLQRCRPLVSGTS